MGKNNQQRPSLEAVVAELAARAIRCDSDGERSRILRCLRSLCAESRSCKVVERVLANSVRMGLDLAWQGGWEPADLHRLMGRRHTSDDQALLVDAMTAHLGQYAESTVDPRWLAQLRELDGTQWWPDRQTYLGARGAMSWAYTLDSVVSVLTLLGRLPKIERLGPPPGDYTPPRHAQQHVDERILSRVRALLAKAESTTFEAEAETFTAGAQSLMARHSIDAALLSATHPRDDDAPKARRIGIDAPYETPKAVLLTQVAAANRCRAVWTKDLGFATVVGFKADLDAVETLFTSLLVQATAAVSREGSRVRGNGASRTRSFRLSFLSSFAHRIGERLQEVMHAETAAAAANEATAGSGRELVPLLAARSEAVDNSFDEMFPELTHRALSLGRDYEGWESGRRAADRAALHRGAAVERRGA